MPPARPRTETPPARTAAGEAAARGASAGGAPAARPPPPCASWRLEGRVRAAAGGRRLAVPLARACLHASNVQSDPFRSGCRPDGHGCFGALGRIQGVTAGPPKVEGPCTHVTRGARSAFAVQQSHRMTDRGGTGGHDGPDTWPEGPHCLKQCLPGECATVLDSACQVSARRFSSRGARRDAAGKGGARRRAPPIHG